MVTKKKFFSPRQKSKVFVVTWIPGNKIVFFMVVLYFYEIIYAIEHGLQDVHRVVILLSVQLIINV